MLLSRFCCSDCCSFVLCVVNLSLSLLLLHLGVLLRQGCCASRRAGRSVAGQQSLGGPRAWMPGGWLWVTPCSNWNVLYILRHRGDVMNGICWKVTLEARWMAWFLSPIHPAKGYGKCSTIHLGVRVGHDGERTLTFTEHPPAWNMALYAPDSIRSSQQPNEIDAPFSI